MCWVSAVAVAVVEAVSVVVVVAAQTVVVVDVSAAVEQVFLADFGNC